MAIISLLAFAIPPHIYKEGEFHWTGQHSLFAWSMVIINVSQVLALCVHLPLPPPPMPRHPTSPATTWRFSTTSASTQCGITLRS